MLRLERFSLLSEHSFSPKSYNFSISNNKRQLAHGGVCTKGCCWWGGGGSLKLQLEGSTLLNSPQAQFIQYLNKNRRRAILPLEGEGQAGSGQRQGVRSGWEQADKCSLQSPLKMLTLKKSILMKLFPSLQIIKLGDCGFNECLYSIRIVIWYC